jgi:hypothetical protein
MKYILDFLGILAFNVPVLAIIVLVYLVLLTLGICGFLK